MAGTREIPPWGLACSVSAPATTAPPAPPPGAASPRLGGDFDLVHQHGRRLAFGARQRVAVRDSHRGFAVERHQEVRTRIVQELLAAVANEPFDYTPPTDQQPYFFNLVRPLQLFSGEGLVVDLNGPGRVLLQTRSSDAFLSWLIPKLPKSDSGGTEIRFGR